MTGRTTTGRLIATLLVVAVLATGCGGVAGDGPPRGGADLTGLTISVEPSSPLTEDCVEPDPDAASDQPVTEDDPPVCTDPETAPIGTVTVEEQSQEWGAGAITFTVTHDTAIWVETPDGAQRGTLGDIALGNEVSGWHDGAVADSYPAKAAAVVLIVRRG